ncbi:MAG: cyanophycin synthetase, partial [Bacteroidota bacterium]
AVIETGLGGRLDSTNVIRPEISVITNIDYDHQALLGNTLGQIAREKAGIIKKYTPVIIGAYHQETEPVFRQKAHEMNAPLRMAESAYRITPKIQQADFQLLEVVPLLDQRPAFEVKLDLAGYYQTENLRTVLAAVDALIGDGWEIPLEAIKKGLSNVRPTAGLRGRMELLAKNPHVLCDTGHNKAGIIAVMNQLRQIPHANLHIVWGMVKDKDIAEILPFLPREARYYWVEADLPRSLMVERLAAEAQEFGLNGSVYPSVRAGVRQAVTEAAPDDLVFIGGSTFVVAETLEQWSVNNDHGSIRTEP